jgi:hypothetical protein
MTGFPKLYWNMNCRKTPEKTCCLHHQGDEALIALMMEAASTSETLVNFYQTTWHYNPEDPSSYLPPLEPQLLLIEA